MTEPPKAPETPDPKAEKAKRLAAALRANLKRRKGPKAAKGEDE